MTFELYGSFDDPYIYPETTVLKNRLDLRDSGVLEGLIVVIEKPTSGGGSRGIPA
jgi:hypothetical protein